MSSMPASICHCVTAWLALPSPASRLDTPTSVMPVCARTRRRCLETSCVTVVNAPCSISARPATSALRFAGRVFCGELGGHEGLLAKPAGAKARGSQGWLLAEGATHHTAQDAEKMHPVQGPVQEDDREHGREEHLRASHHLVHAASGKKIHRDVTGRNRRTTTPVQVQIGQSQLISKMLA